MQKVEIPPSLADLGALVNRYMALIEDYGYALREYALNPVGFVPILQTKPTSYSARPRV